MRGSLTFAPATFFCAGLAPKKKDAVRTFTGLEPHPHYGSVTLLMSIILIIRYSGNQLSIVVLITWFVFHLILSWGPSFNSLVCLEIPFGVVAIHLKLCKSWSTISDRYQY
jgi:hypothetical protein